MTAKHTPGPWTAGEVVSSRRGEYSAEVYAAGYQHIVTVVEGTRARCLANARLIAASPTLRDFVQRVANQTRETMGGCAGLVDDARDLLRTLA